MAIYENRPHDVDKVNFINHFTIQGINNLSEEALALAYDYWWTMSEANMRNILIDELWSLMHDFYEIDTNEINEWMAKYNVQDDDYINHGITKDGLILVSKFK